MGNGRSEWRTKSLGWLTWGKRGKVLKRALPANRGSPSRSSASFWFLCSLFQTSPGAGNLPLRCPNPLLAWGIFRFMLPGPTVTLATKESHSNSLSCKEERILPRSSVGALILVPQVLEACSELSPVGRSSWELITFLESASRTWLSEGYGRGGGVPTPPCRSRKD